MSISTLNDIFFAAIERNLERMMLASRGRAVVATFVSRIRPQGRPLPPPHSDSWGILVPAIAGIAILSENRPEWPMADMASLLLGAVTVPLYTTLTAEQSAFTLNDSGCRAIFLSIGPPTAKTSTCSFSDAD